MKFNTHTYYVTPMTHKWFPWQPPTTDSLRQFSLKSVLHFSNLPTMVHMEIKLWSHIYLIFSTTTINRKFPRALFPITTSSLLKLANHAMHGAKTWYACVFERFYDNYQQKKFPQALFPITTSSRLKLANHAMHGAETWYASGTLSCNYFFTSQTSNDRVDGWK